MSEQTALKNLSMIIIAEFEIPGLPSMTNGQRCHWRKIHRERQKWKDLVRLHFPHAFKPPSPLDRAVLSLTRMSARQPDADGLVSSFKGVLDGLVEMGVLKDDSPAVIGFPKFEWAYAAPRKGKIKIKIEAPCSPHSGLWAAC